MNDINDEDSGQHPPSQQTPQTATLLPSSMIRTNFYTFVGVMTLIAGVVTGYCDIKNTLSDHARTLTTMQAAQATTLSTLGEVRDALLVHNLLGAAPSPTAEQSTAKGRIK